MAHPYNMPLQRRSNRVNGAHVAVPFRRVIWSDDELQSVAREAFAVLEADKSLSIPEAARRAQANVLSAERHRVIKQERDIQAFMPIWTELKRANEAAQRLAPETTRLADPTPTKARKAMVRWTSDERRVIALESKKLMSDFENMERLEAIRKAIDYALPAERHRVINTFGEVAWIEDEWKALEEVERATRAEQEARERAAEAERAAEESRRAIEAARAEADAAKAIDPASMPFDTLIEAIGVKVAGMLLRSIGEHLQESIMQRISDALGQVTMPAALPEGVSRLHPAPRHRKPRVLIVGLLNQQEQDMARAMGEVLSLDFAKSEHHTTLEDKAKGADLVVLMTKFISHKHQDIVQRVNEHVVYRHGGVSELKRWLTQWVNGEVITAAA